MAGIVNACAKLWSFQSLKKSPMYSTTVDISIMNSPRRSEIILDRPILIMHLVALNQKNFASLEMLTVKLCEN